MSSSPSPFYHIIQLLYHPQNNNTQAYFFFCFKLSALSLSTLKATMHVKHKNLKKSNTSSSNLIINLHLVKYLGHGNPISQVLNISARCSSIERLQLKQGKTLCFLLSRQNDRKLATIFLFFFKAQAFSKMSFYLRQLKSFLNYAVLKPTQLAQYLWLSIMTSSLKG